MDFQLDTNVSEEYAASIFTVEVLKKEHVPPKRRQLLSNPHGVSSQKSNIEKDDSLNRSGLSSLLFVCGLFNVIGS
jgi:hypothetical protein